MRIHETKRLILRKYTEDDFAAVHSYGSNPENLTYMLFGPNTEEDTWNYIRTAIKDANETPITKYRYAVVLKETGSLIGGCDIHYRKDDEVEIGWIVHQDHWNKGYGTEMGKELLRQCFDELNIRRAVAYCDAENIGSYRVMEKLGMRREGHHFDVRPANKNSATGRPYSDSLCYAILNSDWEMHKEIDDHNAQPFEFNGFKSFPSLTNGDISLICTAKKPGDPVKNWAPCYYFAVCKNGEQVGTINLRIGNGGGVKNDNLYYGGHIGYAINEEHRGNNYAAEACKLVLPIAKAHKMPKLIITNNYTNIPSRRVCEKLNLRHLRLARLPEHADLYKEGQRFVNIYEWDVAST